MSRLSSLARALLGLLRWVARLASVLLIFMVVATFVGEGRAGQLLHLKTREALGFAAIAVQIIGLVLAFRWEALGGIVVVAGFLGFAVLAPNAIVSVFLALPITGILHFVHWWLAGLLPAAGTTRAPRRGPGVLVWSLVALFLALVTNEMFLSPPLMAPRQVTPPAGLIGSWQGTGRVPNAWVRQQSLPVRLAVHQDGSVEGQVGEARLVRARLGSGRSWFGQLTGISPEYVIRGDLEGRIVAAEGISCTSASIAFGLVGQRFGGTLFTSCTGTAAPERAPFQAFLMLDRQ